MFITYLWSAARARRFIVTSLRHNCSSILFDCICHPRTSWHVGTQAKGNCPIHSKRMQEWEGETTESTSRISPSGSASLYHSTAIIYRGRNENGKSTELSTLLEENAYRRGCIRKALDIRSSTRGSQNMISTREVTVKFDTFHCAS